MLESDFARINAPFREAGMNVVKRLSIFVLAGAVVGAVVASMIVPAFLVSNLSSTHGCDCGVVATSDALNALVQRQAIAAGIAAFAALVLGVIITVRGRKKAPASAETTSATPPPAAS